MNHCRETRARFLVSRGDTAELFEFTEEIFTEMAQRYQGDPVPRSLHGPQKADHLIGAQDERQLAWSQG